MEHSNRKTLTIGHSHDQLDRLTGHCSRDGMDASAAISSTAGPAHTYMDIWAAPLAAAPDLTAVLEKDVLTEEQTPEQAQAQVDLQASSEEEMEDQELMYLRIAWWLQRRNFRCWKETSWKEWSKTEAEAEVNLSVAQDELREKIYNLLDTFAEWAAAKGGNWRGWFAKLSDGPDDVEFNGQDDVEADQIVSDWIEQRDREENYHSPEQIAEAKEAQAEQDQQDQQDKEDYYDDWVTVENGDGTTRQIAGTQYEEDFAAGLLVDVGGYLIYKSDVHRVGEESDDEYISRLDAKIQIVNAECAAERTAGTFSASLPIASSGLRQKS